MGLMDQYYGAIRQNSWHLIESSSILQLLLGRPNVIAIIITMICVFIQGGGGGCVLRSSSKKK